MENIGSVGYETGRMTFSTTLRQSVTKGVAVLATADGATGPALENIATDVSDQLKGAIFSTLLRNGDDQPQAIEELAMMVGVATAHVAQSVVEMLWLGNRDMPVLDGGNDGEK